MNHTRVSQISRVNPVTDAAAAGLVSHDTLHDLAEQIMAGQIMAERIMTSADDQTSTARPRTGPAKTRRRLLVAVPATAAIAAAAITAAVLASPGQQASPPTAGPTISTPTTGPPATGAPVRAQALSFTRVGGYIDIIVRNPVADPAIYRAEFAAHHLHISLTMVPVSPSLVGTLVYAGFSTGKSANEITTITAKGRCWTGGAGNECPVGVRVPFGYRGEADFTFGRAARPGEQYESTGSVTAPGEAMHGLHYQGLTVAAVLAMLRARHVTVPQYRPEPGIFCGTLPHPVPSSWIVGDADPWALDQVLLWVAPPGAHHCANPTPRGAPPAPSASPASG